MARTYKRDGKGRFSGGGGSSAPRGTIAKGGRGVSGSTARSIAAIQGRATPSGGTPRLQAKAGAKRVMKEGIGSPSGKARAAKIKADASERAAKKQLSKAKKLPKGPRRQAAEIAAQRVLDKAQRARVKAEDAMVRATR